MLGVLSGAVVLLLLAAVLLVAGLSMLAVSPLLAARLATTISRPRLERRASGPDRMRALINAQRSERAKRTLFSGGFVRTGLALSAAAVLALVVAIAAWLAGL